MIEKITALMNLTTSVITLATAITTALTVYYQNRK